MRLKVVRLPILKGSRQRTVAGSLAVYLLSGAFFILSGSKVFAAVDSAPYFTAGVQQALASCQGVASVSLNSALAVMDSDVSQTETFFVAAAPVSGTLSGFVATMLSTGTVLVPSGLGYAPAAGFTGLDSFTIGVTDGIDSAYTTVLVTVYPLPVLTSSTIAGSVCSGAVFNYTPAGSAGATFSWSRPYVPGISNPAAAGVGNPAEVLNNATYYDEVVTYLYTITANGCSTNADVSVTVHPIPALVSGLNDTVCSSSTLSYVPASLVAGATFSWSRAVVTGIAPAYPSAGTGIINEVLVSDTTDTAVVVYTIVATANGCSITRYLSVAVIPQAAITGITTTPPDTLCMGAQFMNFGAGVVPPAGMAYSWSAVNADLWAVGSTRQYALVSFPDTGKTDVILAISGGPSHCMIFDTAKIYVSNAAAFSGSVIYYNYQFVFRDNTQDTYQWGYDNVYTLDSTLIPGATFQSYPILSPDFLDNYYWVITTKDGCMQKTYYSNPLSVLVNSNVSVHDFSIIPNPSADKVNLSVTGGVVSSGEWVITDMLGRVILRKSAEKGATEVSVSGWSAGCYLVMLQDKGSPVVTRKMVVSE